MNCPTFPSRSFSLTGLAFAGFAATASLSAAEEAAATRWNHLSSGAGSLATQPGGTQQQFVAIVADIDNDGDLEVVVDGAFQAASVWWWEISAQNFDRNVPCKRYLLKHGEGRQHHNQIFGDVLGAGGSQVALWNQTVASLLLAEDQRQGNRHNFIEGESADPANQLSESLRYLESMSLP